jgi:predicted glycosyltransferase
MRVLFWVQNLLGTGHLRRAGILAQAMAREGLEVTVANGGPPAAWLVPEGLRLEQLPPIRARDLHLDALLDDRGQPVDDALWDARRQRLLALLAELRPAVLITEMFPFGRRRFRAELLPLLGAAAAMRPRPRVLSSVRDILVGKPDQERYVWMRDAALRHFDRVLVHTDPAVVPFSLTFPLASNLGERLVETGYVTDASRAPAGDAGRGEVLVSAGGGRVGMRLLEASIEGRALSRARNRPWRLVAGGNVEPKILAALRAGLPPGMLLEGQRDDFQTLLANSLLSVSQAGYNTVVEALKFGKTMVLVPFETRIETEQRTRADRLAELGLAGTLRESELGASSLARAVDDAMDRPLPPVRLDLGGAARTASLVAALAAGPAPAGPGIAG